MRRRALVASAILAVAPLLGSGHNIDVSKSPIFPKLVNRVTDPSQPPIQMPIGEGIVYRIEGIDARGLSMRRIGSDPALEPPLERPWWSLSSDAILDLYRAVPADGESALAFFESATDLGFPDEASQRLQRAIEANAALKGAADVLLSKRLGKPVPNGGFLYFRDAFVTPDERDTALADLADAWLAERQMAIAAKAEDAEGMFAKAVRYLTRGHYELGVKVMRKIASVAAGTGVADRAASRSTENDFLNAAALYSTGDPKNRADFVIAGDGYVLDDRAQRSFDRAADLLVRHFLDREVFREYAGYVNFHRVNAWSRDDGVGTWTGDKASTAFGGKWSDAAQGQVTVDHALVARVMERFAPFWDTALVMVKRGSLGTGGGRVAAFAHAATGVAFHEFGHAFAGLLDEYSTQVSKTPPVGPGPVGVNVTNTDDPEKCPWKHWLDAKEPGVGIYPGGAGRAKGAWHPTELGCVMESGSEFCPVCREQVVLTIYSRVRPVEEYEPKEAEFVLPPQGKLDFRVRVLRPSSRPLAVAFTFNGKPLAGSVKRESVKAEAQRPSASLEDVTFTLDPTIVAIVPGYANVIEAVVKDETPWVLKDPEGRLTQKIRWTVKGAGEEKK